VGRNTVGPSRVVRAFPCPPRCSTPTDRDAALDRTLDLAAYAHTRLAADPRCAVPAAPELSTVVFRLRGGDTAELLRRVNAERRVHVSGAHIRGRFTGRIRVLHHRTCRAHVDEAVDALRRHAAALLPGGDRPRS
jgi:aromatic-L-amino-acid decarboxylase